MAFDKYKDGAWMEPESAVKRYSNGAWTECKSAKTYKDGAWTDIWGNVKTLTELSNTITKGILQFPNGGLTFEFVKIMDYYGGSYGTMEGGGDIVFYLEGKWNNPTISFDWSGGFDYKSSTDDKTWNRVSAGSIAIYTREDTDYHYERYKTVVDPIGSTLTDQTNLEDDSGSYSSTLVGEYDRVGLRITVNSFAGTFYSSDMIVCIKNLQINGGKVAYPASSAFDNQEWPM